ncbi:MAG: hypothetical protein ABI167_08960 [Nitrosospira sp.]
MSDYNITLSNPSTVIGTAAHQLEEIISSRHGKPIPGQNAPCVRSASQKKFIFHRDIFYACLLPAVIVPGVGALSRMAFARSVGYRTDWHNAFPYPVTCNIDRSSN